MSKTIEEINKIIDKVETNLPKGLSGDDAEEILGEIISDLKKVKLVAETEQKEVVEKIEAIKKGVNKSLANELDLLNTQDALNKVKSGLEEVKEEIKKAEEALKISAINQSQNSRAAKTSFLDYGSRMTADMVKMHESGTEMGGKALPIIGTGIGAASSAAFSGMYGLTMAATHLSERGIDEGTVILEKGMDMTDKAREGLKDFTENMANIGADMFGKTREGAQVVTQQVIGEGADITKQMIKNLDVLDASKDIVRNLAIGADETKAIEETKARIAESNAQVEVAKANAQVELAKSQTEALKIQLELARLQASQQQPPK